VSRRLRSRRGLGFRRLLPPWKTGGLDFSPLIVIIAIQFVERVVLSSLRQVH